MASSVNYIKNGYQDFTGNWEDVQSYTNVKLVVKSQQPADLYLQWSNSPRGNISDDIIKVIDLSYNTPLQPYILTRDHYARWFRLIYDTSGHNDAANFQDCSINLSCLHLNAPNYVKIVDNHNQNLVELDDNNQGFNVLLSDYSGNPITTTNVIQSGEQGYALYTHFVDSNNESLKTISGDTISVALKDNQGYNLTTLGHIGEDVNSLVVHTSDVSGHSQAATEPVRGADVCGNAMYLSLGVDSTKTSNVGVQPNNFNSNALYVNLRTSDGRAINKTNPLWVRTIANQQRVFAFNIEQGIKGNLSSVSSLSNNSVILKSLYVYNNGPITLWLNAFDLDSVNTDITSDTKPNLSIPIPGHSTRDITLGRGLHFNNGLVFNCYTGPATGPINSRISPDEDVLFVFGTWNLGVLSVDNTIVQQTITESKFSFGQYDD